MKFTIPQLRKLVRKVINEAQKANYTDLRIPQVNSEVPASEDIPRDLRLFSTQSFEFIGPGKVVSVVIPTAMPGWVDIKGTWKNPLGGKWSGTDRVEMGQFKAYMRHVENKILKPYLDNKDRSSF